MKVVLGIHIGHDRGACIIGNAKVLGAISQERLDRVKYSRSSAIPFLAIDALLKYCKIAIADVCCIGLSYDGIEGDNILELYKKEFFQYYNCSKIPFLIVNHHDAHAYATFFASGLKKSLIFICDGGGDYHGKYQEAESLYIGCKDTVSLVSSRLQDPPTRRIGDSINYIFPQMPNSLRKKQISIGRKYEQITHLLGFGWGEAGKTMGLASYGQSLIDFSKLQYQDLNFSLSYGDIIDIIYAKQILSGMNFDEYLKQESANIARTVQEYTEIALTSLIKKFVKVYSCENICLAGGVFLNCLTNQEIISNCNLKNVFILPSSGDDGQALGCAYYAYLKFFECKAGFQTTLPYLGLSYSDEEIESVLQNKNIKYIRLDDMNLSMEIAKNIAENKIVAIHRGRTELGPRALCHRSIIANPMNPKMKDILNNRVKHREAFRPFAPAVLDEDQYTYFDLKAPSYYMLIATKVKEKYRNQLPSITHVDNTARVQAVTSSEPFVYQILLNLKHLTGHGAIINTSFNLAGEPIVESPIDTINTFLRTDIDLLVIGNYLINKNNQ